MNEFRDRSTPDLNLLKMLFHCQNISCGKEYSIISLNVDMENAQRQSACKVLHLF